MYVHELFEDFKTKYGKNYTGEEHDLRLLIFHSNLKKINEFYSSKEKHTYSIGITKFSDLTP